MQKEFSSSKTEKTSAKSDKSNDNLTNKVTTTPERNDEKPISPVRKSMSSTQHKTIKMSHSEVTKLESCVRLGGLPAEATEETLQNHFAIAGQCARISIKT